MMAKREKREHADMFKALGDPTRLRIYQFLRGRCWPHAADSSEDKWIDNGPTVTEVCATVTGSKKITSKVSQHLKELRIAGLITIERRGKNMICGVNHLAASSLVTLLNSIEKVESAELEKTDEVVVAVEPVPITVEAIEATQPSKKKHAAVEVPVVDVELVKPRRKSKASSNGNEPPPQTAATA
jgi:ArsR family transcriptional regulator